ncbi:MAG: hypothetical protein PF518_08745 [Spirochaetaceae bacterium]|jgi:FMN phosphatase YigB (HAD superfamily)|nr:hypothetical protein [Spirochaetaceae bacterium]
MSELNQALFVDFNGTMLTNEWGHLSRKKATELFILNLELLNQRNSETECTCESSELSIEDYLWLVRFHEQRAFTQAQFQKFIFTQSTQYPEMIQLVRWLKTQYGLKIDTASIKGNELDEYRIRKFKLDRVTDSFISTCFVHIGTSDVDNFRNALDTAEVPVDQVLYIEKTPMLVEAAESLGIKSIFYKDYTSTRMELASFGLQVAQ